MTLHSQILRQLMQPRKNRYNGKRKDKEALNLYLQFNKKLMTSWLTDETYASSEYDENSPFLNKAIAPGTSRVVTFTSVTKKERPEDTKIGSPGDTYFEFWLVGDNGKEYRIDQNSSKGSFFKAMRGAEVAEGETVQIERTGEGVDTRWTIKKMVDGQWKEVTKEEPAF